MLLCVVSSLGLSLNARAGYRHDDIRAQRQEQPGALVAAGSLTTLNPQPSTFNPQPSTLNPQPSTLKPQTSNLNPQPSTLQPQPSNTQHSTLNASPSTLNPQPSTLNPQPSALNPQPCRTTHSEEEQNDDPGGCWRATEREPSHYWSRRESGPLRAVQLSCHKWPGGSVT